MSGAATPRSISPATESGPAMLPRPIAAPTRATPAERVSVLVTSAMAATAAGCAPAANRP